MLLPPGQVGPPRDHHGAGERDAEGALDPPGLQDHVPHGNEMPLPPIGPGRDLLGPGRIRRPGGQGDSFQGGVGVGLAQVVAGRHGHNHLACHMPRGERAERREPSLRTLPALLGGRPPPVPPGRSPPVWDAAF